MEANTKIQSSRAEGPMSNLASAVVGAVLGATLSFFGSQALFEQSQRASSYDAAMVAFDNLKSEGSYGVEEFDTVIELESDAAILKIRLQKEVGGKQIAKAARRAVDALNCGWRIGEDQELDAAKWRSRLDLKGSGPITMDETRTASSSALVELEELLAAIAP